jgi:hypothetical protein
MSSKEPLSLKESFDKVRSLSGATVAAPFLCATLGVGSINYGINSGHPILAIAVGAGFLAASLGGCYLFDKKAKQVANEAIANHDNSPKPN